MANLGRMPRVKDRCAYLGALWEVSKVDNTYWYIRCIQPSRDGVNYIGKMSSYYLTDSAWSPNGNESVVWLKPKPTVFILSNEDSIRE